MSAGRRRRPKAVCPYCGGLVQVVLDGTLIGNHQNEDRLPCAGSAVPPSPGSLIEPEEAPQLWRSGLGIAAGGDEAKRLFPSRVRRVRTPR